MARRVLPFCTMLLLTWVSAYSAPAARDAGKAAPAARPAGGVPQPQPQPPVPSFRGPSSASPASSAGSADAGDLSPRGVLKQLAAALRDGDVERIRGVRHAAT